MAQDRGGPHRTFHKIQEWQQLVSLMATNPFTKWVEAIFIKDETGEATSKAMMDIFNTHGSPEVILSDQWFGEWTNKTLKTATGKSIGQGAGETEGEVPEQNQEEDQVLRHPGKLLRLEEGRKEGETWETLLLFHS